MDKKKREKLLQEMVKKGYSKRRIGKELRKKGFSISNKTLSELVDEYKRQFKLTEKDRERLIKELVKKGYSKKKIGREIRAAGFKISDKKLRQMIDKFRVSDEVKEEIIKELVKERKSIENIGIELRKRGFRISDEKLRKLVWKHRKFVCVKNNEIFYPFRNKDFGIIEYPFKPSEIHKLLEKRFFGVYSICDEFIVEFYIGNNEEEILSLPKLCFLYHIILTETKKLKLREGCCEGGTELERFTLQLLSKYESESVYMRDCEWFLNKVLQILEEKGCSKEDEEALEKWIEYLEEYLRETEEI